MCPVLVLPVNRASSTCIPASTWEFSNQIKMACSSGISLIERVQTRGLHRYKIVDRCGSEVVLLLTLPPAVMNSMFFPAITRNWINNY